MAELADALDSGSSRGNSVEVQVLLPASKERTPQRGVSVLFAVKPAGLEPSFAAGAVKLLAFAHPIELPLCCFGANAVQLVLPPQPKARPPQSEGVLLLVVRVGIRFSVLQVIPTSVARWVSEPKSPRRGLFGEAVSPQKTV